MEVKFLNLRKMDAVVNDLGEFNFESLSDDSSTSSTSGSRTSSSSSNSNSFNINKNKLPHQPKINFLKPKIYSCKINPSHEKLALRLDRRYWYYNSTNQTLYNYKNISMFIQNHIHSLNLNGAESSETSESSSSSLSSETSYSEEEDDVFFSKSIPKPKQTPKSTLNKILPKKLLTKLGLKNIKDFLLRGSAGNVIYHHYKDCDVKIRNGRGCLSDNVRMYSREKFLNLLEDEKERVYKIFEGRDSPMMLLSF